MAEITINVNGVEVGMDKEEVSKALEAGKLELSVESLIKKDEDSIIYTKEEHEKFTKNLANEEYRKGKEAGSEMTVKGAKEKTGLDFEGKTLDNFIDAFKTKILEDAKAEPSKKIKELEEDKSKLLKNYKNLETEFTTFKEGISRKETRSKKDSELMRLLPKQGLKVDPDLTLLALKNKAGIDIEFSENGKFLTLNGEMIKNTKTMEPEEPTSVINKYLTDLNLMEKSDGGKGGSDNTGGEGGSSYDKFVKEMKSKEVYEGSEKFNEEMGKRIKEGILKL